MSMHSVGERHHDSIEKLFGYACLLAKEDVEIVFDGKHTWKYAATTKCSISATLFKTDGCHSSGKCCMVPYDLAYTREGYERAKKAHGKAFGVPRLIDALMPVDTVVNGKSVDVWVHLNDKPARYTGRKTCDFVENPKEGPFKGKFICGLHGGYNRPLNSAQPLHCIMPHMVVRKRGDGTTFVGRMQFGRNWRFGCPVVFGEGMQYFDHDYQHDLDKLGMVEALANDMGIKTWVPDILDWMHTNKETIEWMVKNRSESIIDISGRYGNENRQASIF